MNLELDLRPLRTRAFKPDSQCFRILEHLRSGKTLTPFEAMQRFGTLALHSRIAELREAGWTVKCHLVTVGEKQVGRYSL